MIAPGDPLTWTPVPYSAGLVINGPDYIPPRAKAPGGPCSDPKQKETKDGAPSPNSAAWDTCGTLKRQDLPRSRHRSRRRSSVRGGHKGCWTTGVLLDNWIT